MDVFGNCDEAHHVTTGGNTTIQSSRILNIDIQSTDTIVQLPDIESEYDFVNYNKLVITPHNVQFYSEGLRIGLLYHHRLQNIQFYRFKTNSLNKWLH